MGEATVGRRKKGRRKKEGREGRMKPFFCSNDFTHYPEQATTKVVTTEDYPALPSFFLLPNNEEPCPNN
jgi:hypothetical protein